MFLGLFGAGFFRLNAPDPERLPLPWVPGCDDRSEKSNSAWNDVLLNSSSNSNPAGLPTILAALGPESCITIGDGTGISGASIVSRRSVTIGSRVLIGAGACIWDTGFHLIDPVRRLEHPTRDAASAPVTIDDEVFVGVRALVVKGVKVGRKAVIGAGAVVTKDVRSGEIVAGNPARVVGSIDLEKTGE